MNTGITFEQAVEGYLLDARARQLSPRTIGDYINSFNHFRRWLDGADPRIAGIDADEIRRFLDWLGNSRAPHGGAAPRQPVELSQKSILNIHTALSALWTWATAEGYADDHIVRAVNVKRPDPPAIEPFSRDDVQALLEACDYTDEYDRPGKSPCRNRRPTAARDRALILIFLDTGARNGEICYSPRLDKPGLLVGQVDRRNLSTKVVGKGSKERVLRISHRTMKAVWEYLLERDDARPDDHLFLSSKGHKRPLTTDACYHLIHRLGERCGIEAYPHRFRHTFAINFLRNGGKTLELQQFLGHASLKMVKRYVAIAQVDLDEAHKRASPVANWRL
jgi:site-specific recombinase XerD